MKTLVDRSIVKEHIAILTLQRSGAANALSLALLDDLNEHLSWLETNPSIYVVIITGEGNKAFCAGADLKERKEMDDEQVLKTVTYIGKTFTRIENLPMPVIAAINGVALGGGLELALASDLRFASMSASMSLSETGLAIIPGAGGTQRLARLVGIGEAKRMIYTAQRMDAAVAKEIGLIEELCNDGTLLAETVKTAEQICANGPIAIRLAKQAINQGIDLSIEEGLDLEHTFYQETLHTEDRTEGLRAFSEKRRPRYTGK